MMKKYSEELKSKVIKLHLQEEPSQASLEVEELKKENAFSKKAAAFFAKEI